MHENIHHKNRQRISSHGEVFTSDFYVKDLVNLASSEKRAYWSNENNFFFEPTCGTGNILIHVLAQKLRAINQKYSHSPISPLIAVANSLDSIKAFDIDLDNINTSRSRALNEVINFLEENTSQVTNIIFWAHILCALKFQIIQTETLSSIGDPSKRNLTKLEEEWIVKKRNVKLEISSTWNEMYKSSNKDVKNEAHNSLREAIIFLQGDFKNKKFIFAGIYIERIYKIIKNKSTTKSFEMTI